jgi:hypothetical protein
MHTNETLKIFDAITVEIGSEFRTFKLRTCSAFETRELCRETNARKRRRLRSMAQGSRSKVPDSATPEDIESLPKTLNIHTYKHHGLGDYPNTIREFGTTDSYSTEPVGMNCLSVPYLSLTLILICNRVSLNIVLQNLDICVQTVKAS